MGPCPLPGGKLMFASNRNGFRPPKQPPPCLQLFVMDDDGGNVECIGHLNLGMALHPVVLTDGRIMFSSLESQGLRSSTLWGLWTIHPDGTNWGPVVSAFLPGEQRRAPSTSRRSSPTARSSPRNTTTRTTAASAATSSCRSSRRTGTPPFGPGYIERSAQPAAAARPARQRPAAESPPAVQPVRARIVDALSPAPTKARPIPSIRGQKDSPRVGKFTHPSGAPDNHLLTVWSPGPVNGSYTVHLPMPSTAASI